MPPPQVRAGVQAIGPNGKFKIIIRFSTLRVTPAARKLPVGDVNIVARKHQNGRALGIQVGIGSFQN